MANDPEGFADIAGLAAEFEAILAGQARRLTSEGSRPYTWQEIARPLGISRQAAHKRYAAREDKRTWDSSPATENV